MSGQLFKIKLKSGRILGPLDLERVGKLVRRGKITGDESAREYPNGDWMDINAVPELGQLLVARIEGKLDPTKVQPGPLVPPPIDVRNQANVATQMLPGSEPLPELQPLEEQSLPKSPPKAEGESFKTLATVAAPGPVGDEGQSAEIERAAPDEPPVDDNERTVLDTEGKDLVDSTARTRVMRAEHVSTLPGDKPKPGRSAGTIAQELEKAVAENSGVTLERGFGMEKPRGEMAGQPRNLSQEKTIVFQRSAATVTIEANRAGGGLAGPAPGPRPSKFFETLKKVVVGLALLFLVNEALEVLFPTESANKATVRAQPIRPTLPEPSKGGVKPEESVRIYGEAMRDYVLDNVAGYRTAAEKLRRSASHDMGNVKALAMLASSYLNLIDSSNKDESYFAVISKLIDMSRAKNIELPETVIADVEFFITVNKAEAAQNRIVEYTKTHQFGHEMFYYLALAFYHRGDAQSAARYLGQVPDNKAFSAKVFHLRGLIAEKLGDDASAAGEYAKAIQLNPAHAKSRLRTAMLQSRRGALKEAAAHLDYLVTHGQLLSPKDLADSYYLHSQLSQLYGKTDIALGDMERAVKLDRDNHDYLLELYTLRARAGDTSVKSVRKEARMYFFLGEGEKWLRQGKNHEALIEFLKANESNPGSPLPLVKIGDMFLFQNDMSNAVANYRKAAEKAPNSIDVWSKYINVLIQSYDWEEANKAMNKFRHMPGSASSIDKAAADMYSKQGRHADAQVYYKKSMARESVDPGVYIAYAKSLMATRNFKEAPFFFALALRFDPLNVEALVGTAKCIAETDSIDRAITMLQDELSKKTHASAELLTAIAELQVQKGEWDIAQQYVDQARAANPEYAQPWKVQAKIHLNQEGTARDALDKALAAYKSYSERNPSDPSGYLERYTVYLKKTDFVKAEEELDKIFSALPKYPKLHFYKGFLYAAQGNHKVAAEEYQAELKNNPNHVATLIALGKEKIELGAVAGPGGAQELFTKAMQLEPSNAEAKQQAGYAAYLLKNYRAAIALYNSAAAIDRANPMIHKRLGMAYRDLGDPQGAAASFRRYLEMEPDAPDKSEFEQYR